MNKKIFAAYFNTPCPERLLINYPGDVWTSLVTRFMVNKSHTVTMKCMTSLVYLSEELLYIHHFTHAIDDLLGTLLSSIVVLEVLVLNIVTTTNHEHIDQSRMCVCIAWGGVRVCEHA